MSKNTDVDIAIVGAGSAGIGAAKTLRDKGVSFVMLEGSHRIGGRGYTEEVAPGEMFDLGCHWMHSASLNPYVAIADVHGFSYLEGDYPEAIRWENGWIDKQTQADLDTYLETTENAIKTAARDGSDIALLDAMNHDSPWASTFDYYASLETSRDVDQVSIMDGFNYIDTDENWPIKEGYGNLIASFGADVPVELNCAVKRINWGGDKVQLHSVKGQVNARVVIITVSTGILGAGDIRFSPELPIWKLEAIHGLPLGNHNRICLTFEKNVFADEHPDSVYYADGEDDQFLVYIRPFEQNHIIGVTGGRFAWWLEKAGVQASVDYTRERLGKMFGADILKSIVGHTVTAWGGDPWIKGAYSASLPGQSHQRKGLAREVDDRLFFAGEATSPDFFSTAHGAYLSGIETAENAVKTLAGR